MIKSKKHFLRTVNTLGITLSLLLLTNVAYVSASSTDSTTSSDSTTMGQPTRPGMADLLEKIEAQLEENGTTLPDDWDTMTDTEKMEYLKTNNLMPEMGKENQQGHGIKGERYKKFEGELKDKTDFPDSDSEAVTFLQQRGIIDGYSDGTFRPQSEINRAEAVKILLTALATDVDSDSDVDSTDSDSTTAFSDISASAWYAKYIKAAKKLGIVNGYSNGTFRPGQVVNQAELLKLVLTGFGIDLTDYTVTDSTLDASQWYAVYYQYALDTNLLTSDEITPSKGMTREAFSKLVYDLIGQQEALTE
jgi:hypothetical protein